MIRIATPENSDEVISLVSKRAKEIFDDFMSSRKEEKIIFLHEGGGMLVGIALPFSKGIIATDVLWFVDPDKRKNGIGGELLDVFEAWAKHIGANIVGMTSLNPYLGRQFFEARGYKFSELSYMKEI